MKFSHSLRFNAVPEWDHGYVAYEDLKSFIFECERQRVQAINHGSDIEGGVDNNRRSIAIQQEQDEQVFEAALDAQLEKVITFFSQVFSDVESQMAELEAKLEACPEDPYPDGGVRGGDDHGLATLDGQEEEFQYTQKPGALHTTDMHAEREHRLCRQSQEKLAVPEATSGPRHKASFESRLSTQTTRESELYVEHLAGLRAQLVQLYVLVSDVESYVDLNRRAFAKILKKHDKVLGRRLKDRYLPRVVAAPPFTPKTAAQLHRYLARVEQVYADLFCGGQTSKAVRQMKTHLRDQLTYERNTVWKDMVHQERQQHGAQYKHDDTKTYRLLPSLIVPAKRVHSAACLLFALVVFAVLMNVPIFAQRQENRCFALLMLAAILWATEALPLYATSLLIPFLIVPFGIMRETDGTPMPAHDAAEAVFSSMFSGTIMMLLGGFALAGALSKYGIAKAFASHVLSHAGTRPRWVLLATMAVAAFLSMWISNVATPVLCFSLVDPILRTLEHDSPVAPCLLLGIALASCIGGMLSPISSPQNIITLQYMQPNPGWGAWFAVAMPISILSILICWCLLLVVYRPDRACQHLNSIKPVKGRITPQQIFVMATTILTIILWCVESSIEHTIGSPGVIAAIPLFVFFGTGLLGKDDLHAFLWSVVILAQGGMALGNAVTSSGLLQDIALGIKSGIDQLHPFAILFIFAALVLVFATFVSHTVAALIIVPIVQEVGQHLPVPHPNLLVMGAGLACSAGMGLPVSGFPNMSAVMLEDSRGKQYLTTRDFIVTGIPISIVATLLVCTLGYGIMSAMGF